MPKTYKTEIIGYAFEELSEETRLSIYHREYDDFTQMVELEEVEGDFRQTLIDRYSADPETLEVYYDVSYSQGSGACCIGELDVATVLKDRVGSYFTKVLELIESRQVVIDTISVVRCGPSNFYNHENTCCVEIEYVNDPTEVDGWPVEEAEELEEMLTAEIRELLSDFHSKLRDHYEESTSFEAYCDLMSDSHIVYTEGGKVVDPMFIRNAAVFDGYQLKLDFDHSDYNFT